jgi:hypothetical protein
MTECQPAADYRGVNMNVMAINRMIVLASISIAMLTGSNSDYSYSRR